MSSLSIGGYNYMSPYSIGYAGSYMRTSQAEEASQTGKPVVNPGESKEVSPGRKSSPAECETCKNRKYQDGSDEMVSDRKSVV